MGRADPQVAEFNFGLAKAPWDSAVMADFVAQLAPINAIAEQSPGFVWREQAVEGNAIFTRSVWVSIDELAEFVYRSEHRGLMRRRREWFEQFRPHLVLWWVPAGHIPSLAEAQERLGHLRDHGPTSHGFTLKDTFRPELEVELESTD